MKTRHVGANANVWGSCLVIMRAAGWTLRYDVGDYLDNDAAWSYVAQRDTTTLIAGNPLELLGLTVIAGAGTDGAPYWWVQKGGAVIDDSLLEAGLERALAALKMSDAATWLKTVHTAIADASSETAAHEILGVSSPCFAQILEDIENA